jgi:hydrogenase large subunit
LSDRVRLIALVAEFEAFVETTLFGAPLDEVIAIETLDELAEFGERRRGDFSAFLRLAAGLRLGRGPGPLMSFGAYAGPDGPLFPAGVWAEGGVSPLEPAAIVEDVASSWLSGGPAISAGLDCFASLAMTVAGWKVGFHKWKENRLTIQPQAARVPSITEQ